MVDGSSPLTGDAVALLNKLRDGSAKKAGFNSLILIDLSDVNVPEDDDVLIEELLELYARVARVKSGESFALTHVNAALALNLVEMARLEVVSDLKMQIWKLLCEELPDNVVGVDQSKLVRSIDLNAQMAAAVRFLETFEDRAREAGAITAADGSRALSMTDIARIRDFHARLGPKKFTEVYITTQTAAVIGADGPPQPLFKEHFVRMDLLERDVLGGCEIRETDPLFGQLTVALDPILLSAFKVFNPDGDPCSINLNLETMDTNIFRNFVDSRGAKGLSDLVIEVRAENVIRNMSGYAAARSMIRDKGGRIAVDLIEPAALGALRLAGFGADFVKVNWRPEVVEALARNRRDIGQAQEAGTRAVLTRIDDKVGIAVGREVGITAFQGFEVDDLLL